jgi:hypothetical protein
VPAEIESAIRRSWSLATCDPSDLDDWSPTNPSRGQCGVTALVLNDLLGGELLLAEVRRPDGSRQGVRWWTRVAGIEIDLTREQFMGGEIVQPPRVVMRPPGPPTRCREQYERLCKTVRVKLANPFTQAERLADTGSTVAGL